MFDNCFSLKRKRTLGNAGSYGVLFHLLSFLEIHKNLFSKKGSYAGSKGRALGVPYPSYKAAPITVPKLEFSGMMKRTPKLMDRSSNTLRMG